MGNKHSHRAHSASASTTRTKSGKEVRSNSGQPALAQAAAAAACAVTAAASAGTSETSPSTNQHHQHLTDAIESLQPIQLTPYQKLLLREAWQKINKKGSGSIGTMIFRRMFSKEPNIKQVFQHVTVVEGVFGCGMTPMQMFHQHAVLFVQVLNAAIENLDDLRPFVKDCIEYGAKHGPYKSYGFKADMWDTFGQCMTEAAREWEGWKKHRETIRAWTILVSFIVDRMRQGYEGAVRRQRFMQQLSQQQQQQTESTNEEIGTGSMLTIPDIKTRANSPRLADDNSPRSRKSSRNQLPQGENEDYSRSEGRSSRTERTGI